MKKYPVIFVLIVFTVPGIAQILPDDLNQARDSIIRIYLQHADTVTKNTWLNIMQSNKYLEEIVNVDSLIIQATADQENCDSLRRVFIRNLNETESNIKVLEQQRRQAQVELDFYKKIYYMSLILSALFLIIIFILILLSRRLNKSLKEKDKRAKEYYTSLHSAQNELEASRITENQLASEINKLKKQLSDETGRTSEDYDKLIEEKLMLENQIAEVKKAYELEAAKRDSGSGRPDESSDENKQIIKQLSKELENVQNDYEQLKAENERNKNLLTKANTKDDEIDTLKVKLDTIEQELTTMEEKFNELSEIIKNRSGNM